MSELANIPTSLSLAGTVELIQAAAPKEGEQPALPRFKMVAYRGGLMQLEGWRLPLAIDLTGMEIPSKNMPVRAAHSADRAEGIGHTDDVRVVGSDLLAEGPVSRGTEAAKEFVSAAKNGFPWQASVGGAVRTDVDNAVEYVRAGESGAVNGQKVEGPCYIVRASRLKEISVVDLGADPATSVQLAARAAGGGNVVQPVQTPQNAGDQTTADIIARTRAEQQRVQGIRDLVASMLATNRHVDLNKIEEIAAKAEAEGWSVQQAELHMLRETRPAAPPVRAKRDVHAPKVLEAALCMSVGIKDETLAKDRGYGEDVVARAYPLRNLGLHGVIAGSLEAAGFRAPHGGEQLFRAALECRDIRAAGASTAALPGILGNVANKILTAAFTTVNPTYPMIAEQADLANFQTHTIYRLDTDGAFEIVPDSGEIKHGSLSEDTYTNKLDTYGKMLTLTRQMIVNDDLNSFASLLRQLIRKAVIAVEKAVYTKVMESSNSFYTGTRGNLVTSNGLSISGLGAAEGALLGMVDNDGEPIYAVPAILLVPPALKPLADSVFVSTTLNEAATAGDAQGDGNPYKGRFKVVSSPYLAASAMTGYSSTTWYLMADPNVLPTFQVGFLNGMRQPTVETADAEFNTLGMHMRCYWDFGVARIDYRGTVKNTA